MKYEVRDGLGQKHVFPSLRLAQRCVDQRRAFTWATIHKVARMPWEFPNPGDAVTWDLPGDTGTGVIKARTNHSEVVATNGVLRHMSATHLHKVQS